MNLRSIVKSILPQSLVTALKRMPRRFKWLSKRAQGVSIGKAGIFKGLVELGIRRGDLLLVHSSLSSLGHVDGGPDAVIDALLQAIGPQGTLLMPAYPVVGDWMTYIYSDPLFDPRSSPSGMGRITDVFWRRPGVLRSLHPTHSVAAFGPRAAYLVRNHEHSHSPCGPESPFRKLAELDGRILHLGSPFGNTTSVHVVEDMVASFPRQVYLADPVPMRYLDADGIEHLASVKVHDPALAATRIDRIREKEQEIYNHCLRYGAVRTAKIGLATVHLIEARLLEELLEKLLDQGITIYV